TWNLNAKGPGESLDAWLFPANTPEPDIYSIAFQEIVELTPGQILATDPAKRRMWETYIMDAFEQRKVRKSDYLLFRSEQLVGTAIIIVVKSGISKNIRNVESATKKTGLQGLSGNKGGVGVRLDIADSSVCFMTCHLAAGHGNISERHADYRTISGGLSFLRGKTIDDHEIIIWAADFNYRIGMSNLDVRQYVEGDQLDQLLSADQLIRGMDDSEVFVGYDEGPIIFRPTYKYDNGTDDYDTSEKARIPAWTDRILFKGSALRLKEYNRAELRTSDHRPVFAIFDATIREVDHAKKDAIARDLKRSIRQNETMSGFAKGDDFPSVSPVSKTSVAREKSPRLPPRPTMATGISDKTESALPAKSRAPSLHTTTTPSPHSPLPTHSLNSPRKAVPAIAARTSAFVPSASTLAAFSTSSKRQPPPVPSDVRVSSLAATSPTITPYSTGDHIVVPSSSSTSRRAPPLPPRMTPTPKGSLDVNDSIPDGLLSKVMSRDMTASPTPSNETHISVAEKQPPPVVPEKPAALRSSSLTG
ncbi:MAG: inositol polyphosphate 5-phosphatase, partial [Tremellales sp. Tagirdzhanova-0007]